jgi:O-antigen ligase
MAITAPIGFHDAPALHAAPARRSVEALRGVLLWLTGVSGAFVFIEPSPYEIVALLTMLAFAASGLALRATLVPLVILLVLYNLGFAIAVAQVVDQPKAITWVLVSAFMAMTSLFFAAMLSTNTQSRLRLLMRGYTVAAVIATLAGIVGYFHLLPGASDIVLLYDRVRGTFNDPNVFGAFLVLPALLAFQRILASRFIDALRATLLLIVLLAGLFLSFSRGAWGQFVFGAVLMMALTFITSRSPRERVRIAVVAVLGLIAVTALLAALLSIPQVADLFQQRASLEQSYDVGVNGRFGRHVAGFLLALDKPFGIGPLQFHTIFPEDAHNTYLNAFMSGGWLSGVMYLALVGITLVIGFRFVFVAAPWRPVYIAVYCAFVGAAGESAIIDTDHWRHYFLILGVLWGLIAVTHSHQAARRRLAMGSPLAYARPAAAGLARSSTAS